MRKTIVLGFDGASPDLIKKWVESNDLPSFKKIMAEGVHGKLRTTIPPLTPCAWSSFITGQNPGKHGIYDFFYLNDKYELKLHSSNTRCSTDLWEHLTNYGKRSFVFNVPFTYPPKKINGTLISGITTPSTKADFTYPHKLKAEILKKYPDFRFGQRKKYTEAAGARKAFREEEFNLTELKYKAAMDLMDNEEFDFCMVVFMLLDHIQHWFWKFMDKSHPNYCKDDDLESTIKDAYKRIDLYLSKFMERFPDANIIIMSDHGAGPYYKDVTINKWLMDEGYLFLKPNLSPWKKITSKAGSDKLISKGLNLGLWKLINNFPRLKEFIRKHFNLGYSDIDWTKTQAYSYGYYGPIYINKKLVSSNDEQQKLKEQIKAKLQTIKDPLTQEPLVKQIWDKEQLYQGEKAEVLPDIIIDMGNFSYACSSTFPFGSNELFSNPKTFKSGDHSEYGLFMAYGPDIKQNAEINNINIYDLAPTILDMFSIPAPADMDGKVRKEIFRQGSSLLDTDTRVSKKDFAKDKTQEPPQTLSSKDEDKIKKRLQDMGYL